MGANIDFTLTGNLVPPLEDDQDTAINFNLPRKILTSGQGRAVADGGVVEAESCNYNTLNGLNYQRILRSATFLLTPNANKTSKLYSVIPSNGNGDFTVTRATTATRTNSAGLIEVVPYNLVLWSEMFTDVTWNKNNITITANVTTAPDGALTADKVNATAGNSTHNLQGSQHGATIITSSIYVKKDTHNFIQIFSGSASNFYANFNIDLGTTGTVGAGVTASITSVGNGWYRCSITGTASASSTMRFALVTSATSVFSESWLAVGTESIYLWGAQLVEGTSARDYLRTETRLNIPRIDYSLGSCPNLLLEPQRTNLALRSEEFDNVAWTKVGVGITANSTISPSGIQNADTITGDGTNTTHYINQGIVSVIGTSYTLSVYAKKNTNNFIQIFGLSSGFGVTAFANFDINNGVLGTIGSTATATITNVGNGWYRCTMTATAVGTTNGIFVELISSATSPRAESNTLTTSVFLWGSQFEAGAYATSYIPTTTASVTRNTDSISLGNVFTNGLISASGGTWFVELRGNVPRIRDLSSQFWLGDTASTSLVNAFTFRGQTSSSRLTISKVVAATTTTVFTTTTDTVKVAIKWNGSTADVFVNGVKVVTATAFTTTNMEFLNCFAADVPKYINQMALYTTPLTDPELISLTTL